MKINITIKDGNYNPTVVTKNTLSQVEYKKKNMLYQPPQPDQLKKTVSTSKNKNNVKPPSKQKQEPTFSKETQKKLIKNLDDISKNQASLDMIHNSNNILQRQNQILAQNQKTISQMAQNKPANNQNEGQIRKMLKDGLDKISKQVQQVKKIRDDITKQLKETNKNIKQMKNNKQQKNNPPKDPTQLMTMNQNLRNLTENVQNDIQGLKNMEAIKQLQNFNIAAYEQSINTLKRQLIAYQKESESIQKQLRIRASKLQKLNLPQNLQNQLLQPYTKYLTNKANAIDLHSLRQKVYEKLGVFDYGKFENDIEHLMNQAKNQLSDFDIICKQFRIEVPTLKFDEKQLKKLEFKAPSVLDEYKARKGINFQENLKQTKENVGKNTLNQRQTGIYKQTSGNKKPKTSKERQKIKQMITRPINLANQVPYTRKDVKQPETVLETKNERDKTNLKKRLKGNNTQDQNFNKYLENRAREQLEHIYKQKKQQLKKMQQDLYDTIQQPIHIDMQKFQINNKRKAEKSPKKQKKNQDYDDESFENQPQQNTQKKKGEQSPSKKQQEQKSIKQIGKQALKEKLQKLLKKQNKGNNVIPSPNLIQPQENIPRYPAQNHENIGNLAEGIVSLINNTLTQVNNNLSNSIEKRIQSRSRDENRRQESKSPRPKIYNIPHLEQFRPPPTFKMNLNIPQQQPQQVIYVPQPSYPNNKQPQGPIKKNPSEKMIKKDYNQYRLKDDSELQVSQLSSDSDS